MSQAFADRNLLFGILALQMDFISRDALIGAMHNWLLNKTQSLGKLLVQQGRLTPERLQLLDALVQEHLYAHGDNAQQSLAALSSVASLRADLSSVPDADLQASLAVTGTAPTLDEPTTDFRRFGDEQPGQRYRILRPHARGGIGEVFVAEDLELHREVALKEILPDSAADPFYRTRFLQEAELTGSLEHPGVVPVYGLGHYADGRPYYAMRFVKGDDLKEAIRRFHEADVSGRNTAERTLELRQLLRRFVDVCNAMAYAHSRGVLHRDLKPGNILLGPYGETLVVDWGLAKAVGRADGAPSSGEATLRPASGSGVEPTRLGTAVGTPAYMSPEQAAGRLEQLGPASDVYSLGATLYHLLTGQPPYRDTNPAEVLRQVQAGALTPPRQLKSSTPAALNAICLKAMSRNPADRYASTLDLAGDIEHWLADEPVSAYPEPLPARCRRWARQHRTLVTGAAAAVLVAVVSLTVATALLAAANRRETEAKRLAQTKGEEAIREGNEARANFELARDKSEEAVRERNQARTNFNLAREAVEEYCTKVSNDPRLKEKDLEDLRKSLLESAVKFHQKFVEQQGNDPAVRADLGRAFFDLASITAIIDDKKQALDFYRQAQQIYEDLVAKHPDEPGYSLYLGKALLHQGSILDAFARSQEALAACNAAAKVLTEASERHGSNVPFRSELARTYKNIAFALYDKLGQNNEAMGYVQKGLAQLEEGEGIAPLTVEEQTEKGSLYLNQADILNKLNRPREALIACDKARHILEPLSKGKANLDNVLSILSSVNYVQSQSYQLLGDWDQAVRCAEHAVELDEQRAAAHPRDSLYLVALGSNYNLLSQCLFRAGRNKDGLDALKKAVEVKEKLVHDWPGVPDYEANLARSLLTLANHTADLQEAEALQSRGAAIAQDLVAKYPTSAQYQTALATSYRAKANLFLRKGKREEAIQPMCDGVAVMVKLVRTSDSELHRQTLAGSCHDLEVVSRQCGKSAAAIEPLRAAVAADPKEPQLLLTLGNAYSGARRYEEAIEANRQAIALKEDFADAHCNLGIALLNVGCFTEGRTELQKSQELGSKVKDWPNQAVTVQWLRMADSLIALDKRYAAIQKGQVPPEQPAQKLALARFCQTYKHHYKSAAGFYAAAFAGKPELAEDAKFSDRYNAACAAALAGCGQGEDAADLGDAAKADLRKQSLDWLKAELARLYKELERGGAARQAALKFMQNWKADDDFAGVRGEAALAKLTAVEREEWQKIWAALETALAPRPK